jgi:alpha-glucosidase
MRTWLLGILVAGSFLLGQLCYGVEAPAQGAPAAGSDPWWKHAVFYEIYPRSFADSNDDGIGDINGITSKLDYLQSLGVDALWITPCFPSPQVDFGYDISNYVDIAPEFGTLKDFDNLVAEAKKRNIRILMDLVLNHSSDKHPWFIESSSSKDNPKRNWYIWRDGKNGQAPNNWYSIFGSPAWQLDSRTNQFYYHFFYPEQPDLNWRNPEVKQAMFDVARFWMDRGVAGFRLDAVSTLYEDPNLKDNPILPGKDKFGRPNMDNKMNDRLPQIHEALQDLRKVADSYDDHRVLVGETFVENINELSKMYGPNLDELQLPMNFFFTYIDKLDANEFRKQIGLWDKNPAGGWPVYLFSNHDRPRHYVRYGDGKNNDAIAKLLATMLMTLRGTPIMYYGEELGMTNNDPKRKEDVQDPIGKLGWPQEKGRDGERTPMQWSAADNAGFSTAKPWLPVSDNYKTHNVVSETADANSILNTYKALIELRRTNPALRDGSYVPLNPADKKVLSYARRSGDSTVVVALNMSAEPQSVNIKVPSGVSEGGSILFATNQTAGKAVNFASLALEPFGSVIAQAK